MPELYRGVLEQPEKPVSIGMPFHGVTLNGTLTLGGSGGTKTFTPIAADRSAYVVVLRNPNRVLPTRTPEQVTADAAVGREYRDYALVSGSQIPPGNRYLYGLYPLSQKQLVYFDSRGYPWKVTLNLTISHGLNTISGSARFDRLFHLGGTVDFDTKTVSGLSWSSIGQGSSANGNAPSGTSFPHVVDQVSDGSKALITDSYNTLPWGAWEVTISDTIVEEGTTYPYGGGDITFAVNLTTVVARANIITGFSFAETNTVQFGGITQDSPGGEMFLASPTAAINDWCNAEAAGEPPPPGSDDVIACVLFNGASGSAAINQRLFKVSYNNAGSIVEWRYTLEYSWSYTWTPTGSGEQYQTVLSDSADMVMKLYRGGVLVDTLDIDFSHSYTGKIGFASGETSKTGSVGMDGVAFTIGGSLGFQDDGTGTPDPYPNNMAPFPGSFFSAIGSDSYGGSLAQVAEHMDDNGVELLDAMVAFGLSEYFFEEKGDTYIWWEEIEGQIMPGLLGYGSNKLAGMCEVLIDSVAVPSGSGSGTALRDIFAPDSSVTPDTTPRLGVGLLLDGVSFYPDIGTPVAYDPENNVWTVSAWWAAQGRWNTIHYV